MGGANGGPRDPSEAKLLRRLRAAIAITALALLVLTTIVDLLGRLLVDPGFHVDDVLTGGLIGCAIVAGGISGASRIQLPGGWTLRKDDHDPKHPGGEG